MELRLEISQGRTQAEGVREQGAEADNDPASGSVERDGECGIMWSSMIGIPVYLFGWTTQGV